MKFRKPLPSAVYLNCCFHYDNNAGKLIWKSRPRWHFQSDRAHKAFNTRCAGKAAGAISKRKGCKSYVHISIESTLYQAHRLIAAMHGLEINEGVYVDHIDGDGTNNRISNIRIGSLSDNQRNVKKRKNNKSGFNGVHFSERMGKWVAQANVNGERHHIGIFDNFEIAVEARKMFNELNGFHSNHGQERPL